MTPPRQVGLVQHLALQQQWNLLWMQDKVLTDKITQFDLVWSNRRLRTHRPAHSLCQAQQRNVTLRTNPRSLLRRPAHSRCQVQQCYVTLRTNPRSLLHRPAHSRCQVQHLGVNLFVQRVGFQHQGQAQTAGQQLATQQLIVSKNSAWTCPGRNLLRSKCRGFSK